jgi:hypothetical protein
MDDSRWNNASDEHNILMMVQVGVEQNNGSCYYDAFFVNQHPKGPKRYPPYQIHWE